MSIDYLKKANNYKEKFQFHKALELLEKIKEEKKTPDYYRLKAQCYYQDLKLPTKKRFAKALNLLEIKDDDNPQETLRLKGAIYKRKYLHSRDIKDIYRAISCYEKASKDVKEDKGYGAGNVVYLYYLLITHLGDSLPSDIKKSYIDKSKKIATDTLKALESIEKNRWIYASMSALFLSIEDFKNTKVYLEKYKKSSENEFKREQFVTIEQTIKLFAVLPNKHDDKILEDILSIYSNAKDMIKSVRIGKIGLALSGGGFRASLFHIGVLKRLAELDILRHVQVISTVSGGSILGMYYYLELKNLLENNDNSSLGKEDYINMVNRIEKNFSKAIESNLRMLAFLKLPFTPLTEKLGQLYQEKLYNDIDANITNMNQLPISPVLNTRQEKNFSPEFENFKLTNNVPRIIINATLLNNGHNWQFTSHGMGENEYMTDMSIDDNKAYPFELYTKEKNVTIGSAVASSSAVPILFDPIQLKMGKETIKLSDGGLYDNMGLSSLLADECSHIIVSDGSGQLKEDCNPSNFRLDVLGRITAVLMNRVRDGEYKLAKSLKEHNVLKGLAIFHMEAKSTMDKELQEKLSLVRTDLDAFHELESKGLVYAGYKLSSECFRKMKKEEWEQFNLNIDENNDFEEKFNEHREKYLKILDTSSKVLMKLPSMFSKSILIGLSAIAIFLLYFYLIPTVIVSIIILVLVLMPSKQLFKLLLNKSISLIILPFSFVYTLVLNRLYIYKGRFDGE